MTPVAVPPSALDRNEMGAGPLQPPVKPIDAELLCRHCDLSSLDFETTDDLEDWNEILGQPLALDAVRFGIGIDGDGYNLFALGPAGIGKNSLVRRILEQQAPRQPTPPDWCYVHNFSEPNRPRVMPLPKGRGARLQHDMQGLVDDLRTAIPAAIEQEEHRNRIQMKSNRKPRTGTNNRSRSSPTRPRPRTSA